MQKKPPYRNRALLNTAKDQECTVRLAGVCNHRPDTTVAAHSNSLSHGKGIGLKTPDWCVVFACSDCHDVLDGRRPWRPTGNETGEFIKLPIAEYKKLALQLEWYNAHHKTMKYWFDEGILGS